ncbi:hypothetical protein L9F63_009736, partial [Diploptera punctata]
SALSSPIFSWPNLNQRPDKHAIITCAVAVFRNALISLSLCTYWLCFFYL